jgi:hypothetical protein
MTLKFNGGLCDQSDNMQGSEKFSCDDKNGGPSAEGQHYIVVDYVEFEGIVNVGETFTLTYEDGSWFPSDVSVMVYAGNTRDTLLQEVWFHSSCSKPVFLSNKFGSVQLFGFKNGPDYQGTVSLNQPFETLVEVKNNSTSVNVTDVTVYFQVDGNGAILEQDSNETLEVGMALSYSTSNIVDTTARPLVYLAVVEAVSVDDVNVTCLASVNATDFYAPSNAPN